MVLLARRKLDNMENFISKTLIENEISHEELIVIINEAEKSRKQRRKR